MLAFPASVTAIFRVLVLLFCGEELVVTPVAIETVHCLYASSFTRDAVKVRVAVAPPEFMNDVVNPVVPQPLT